MSIITLAKDQTVAAVNPFATINPAKTRTIQVTITGVATVDIEGSNDGINAVPLQAGVSASTPFTDSDPWHYLRANVKSVTSGTVTIVVGEA